MTLAVMTAWGWVMREEHHLMSVRNAYRASWSLVPGYIWVSIIAMLVIAMGIFGFVIPGILIALCLAVLPAVMVEERPRGMQAVRRVITLSWPRLGHVLLRLIIAGIAIYVPGMIVSGILDGIAEVSDHSLGDPSGRSTTSSRRRSSWA